MRRAESQCQQWWRYSTSRISDTFFIIFLMKFYLLQLRSLTFLINEDIHTISDPEYIARGIENMGVSKDMLNTLYRLQNGMEYILRGDKGVGLEVRRDIKIRKRKEVNCRSLSPLMRDGLIDFVSLATDKTRYYRVRITEEGEKFLRDNLK